MTTSLNQPHYQLSSADNLLGHYTVNIEPFWQQQVHQQQFTGSDNIKLAYAYCLCPKPIGSIVISPGRTESYLKYQELIYDLYHNGYNVFIIDHRGQGLSQRMLAQRQKGHVEQFQHYVDDLAQFVQQIVKPLSKQPLCLIGHSMGATIATLLLQQQPKLFTAAVMSAPMFGLQTAPIPLFIAKSMALLLLSFKRLRGTASDYFISQTDYQRKPFKQNKLTHCQQRYEWFSQLYQQPQLQLGGITCNWLSTSLAAMKQVFRQIDNIQCPMLVLQCQDDEIVSVEAQQKFQQQLSKQTRCELMQLHGAKHEVFFETDQIRNSAVNRLLIFLQQQLTATEAH